MVGVIKIYSKSEVRAVVRFFPAEGVSQSEVHRKLVNVFSRKEVSVWCNNFKDGRAALNDDPEKQRATHTH
jgi:hypothetical protein